MNRPLRVAHVGPHLDPLHRDPQTLLEQWPTLTDVAGAVAAAGVHVRVVQAAHTNTRVLHHGVPIRFVDAAHGGMRALAAATLEHAPDIVHLNGLAFPGALRALHALVPAAIVVQDHGSRLPRMHRRVMWRRGLAHADAVLFTAREQATPFIRAGVLRDVPIHEVPESSSRFTRGDRLAARAALGVRGAPLIAWVGRLIPSKDPVTALHGFAAAAELLPHAHLCMAGDGPLRAELQRRVAEEPRLHNRVTLLGTVPHAAVELLLRSADLFLTTSHEEGSGYALIEALACGAWPVASEIAPHVALLGRGAIGSVFAVDDHAALATVLVHAAPDSTRVTTHFRERLSFDAVGARLSGIYEQVLDARRAALPPPLPRRLRVALIVPGGVDRSGERRVIPVVLWLIERLARAVDLHVIALRQEEEACSYDLLGARVHCLPYAQNNAARLRSILRLHGTHRFDVLHALWTHPQGTLAGAAGALMRTPVLLHMTGGDLAHVPAAGFGTRRHARGRFWLRAATRSASHITVASRLLHEQALEIGIATELLSFGVALDRWPPLAPRPRGSGPANLLHVGTINRVKDHATLLHALAALRARGIPFHAHLVGEDLQHGAVHRLAEDLGLSDVVTFHGWLSHHDVRPLFDSADLLLVSSHFEGNPIVLHEAATAGVPTVGTAVGDLLEWAPEGAARIVPVGDAAALADAAAELLNDDALRLRIAHAAHTRVLAADADVSAARVLELYDLLTRRGTQRTPD